MPRKPTGPPDLVRELRIKTNIVKRMTREVRSYVEESQMQEQKIQKMRDDGRDEWDIKKQVEKLEEDLMMIPDSQGRLAKTEDDLRAWLEENGANEAVAGSELMEEALTYARLDGQGEAEGEVKEQEEIVVGDDEEIF